MSEDARRDAALGCLGTVGGGVVANMVAVSPAAAQGMFDFDLTLPVEAAQVLLLMAALDYLVYKPVGNVIDQREEDIRNKLASVKDNSEEVNGIYVRFSLAPAHCCALNAWNRNLSDTMPCSGLPFSRSKRERWWLKRARR